MTYRKRGRTKLLVWKPRRRYDRNKKKQEIGKCAMTQFVDFDLMLGLTKKKEKIYKMIKDISLIINISSL